MKSAQPTELLGDETVYDATGSNPGWSR